MSFTLDASIPTLDASETLATLDGWSAVLAAYVVSATVTVNANVLRTATVNMLINKSAVISRNVNRTLTWPMT